MKKRVISVNLEAENQLTVYHAEVVQLEKMISDVAWEYIYYFNLRDRLENVGNKEKLRAIARFSARENTRHKDVRVEKCEPKELCCITSFDNNVLWVQCGKCSAWKHTMCECMLTSEKALELLPEYICLTCNLANSRENIVTQRHTEIETMQQKLRIRKQATSEKYSLCKQEASANIGPREESLNLTHTELNVHCEAYHGNVFVGNHCKIININYEKLLAVIEDRDVDHDKFLNVFKVFSEIQPLLLTKRFLTDEEISSAESLCHEFDNMYHRCFPHKIITHKMHECIFNVPKFVARHRTLGLCSEEEGESLHAAFNLEIRAVTSVRDPAEQMRILQERQEMMLGR